MGTTSPRRKRKRTSNVEAYDFSREDRTIQPQRDFVRVKVRPLARLRSGETAHDFALSIDLQNAAGDSVNATVGSPQVPAHAGIIRTLDWGDEDRNILVSGFGLAREMP